MAPAHALAGKGGLKREGRDKNANAGAYRRTKEMVVLSGKLEPRGAERCEIFAQPCSGNY